jgi:hypothetical protein
VVLPVGELIEPLIVGRADERLEIVPEIHRVLSAHMVVECLPVCEDLDELKVVRGRRLAASAGPAKLESAATSGNTNIDSVINLRLRMIQLLVFYDK